MRLRSSTKLALSLVLAAGGTFTAFAQDNFPDVPANHWAYEALARMKRDGLLVGYPDGLYRGSRPASRYELAVAVHAAYTNLRNLIDGMQSQLDALKNINPQDIQNLKDAVAALQAQVNAMKGWGDDIAALKRATEQFDRELRSLGVDVEAMKRDLGDLADRVTRLEKRKPAVDISGDVNFFAMTTNSNNNFGLSQDGRLQGVGGGQRIGLLHDLAVIHEAAFSFSGTNETGPKWKVTAVASNAFGPTAFGNQSSLPLGGGGLPGGTGVYGFAAGAETIYIQDATVDFDTSILGLGFNVDAGRVAYSTNDYVLKRAPNQSYYDNARWNDGLYRFDGALLGFNLGGVKLHVYGGDTSNLQDVNGVELNPWIIANTRIAGGPSEGIFNGYAASTPVGSAFGNAGIMDRALGADASFGLFRNGHVGLDYLVMEQEGTRAAGGNNLLDNGLANRDSIYGANANFNVLGNLHISGAYHKSELTANTTAANSHDNQAWNVKGTWNAAKWGLWGGYREVDTNYFAPGDWGRLGPIVNPGNITGWQAGGHLDLSSVLRLSAEGEWDKGRSNEPNIGLPGFGVPFIGTSLWGTGSNIDKYSVRLDFRVNPNLSVYGAWENTEFRNLVQTSGDNMFFDWATIGIGYGLSSNTKFNLAYQFSNAGDNFGGLAGLYGSDRFTGGVLTSQLTVKF